MAVNCDTGVRSVGELTPGDSTSESLKRVYLSFPVSVLHYIYVLCYGIFKYLSERKKKRGEGEKKGVKLERESISKLR